jgi:hypothetical protein
VDAGKGGSLVLSHPLGTGILSITLPVLLMDCLIDDMPDSLRLRGSCPS